MKETQITRAGIFVFFDPEGYVGNYIDYLLNDLTQNLSYLYIICNGKVSENGRKIFEKYSNNIIVRENKGFEATAWKEAILNYIGIEKLSEYNEVVFINDICYGPFFPLLEVFNTMEKKEDLDFWGITRHYEANDFTGAHQSGKLPEHIQTYFFVVKQRMIISPNFKFFWEQLPTIDTYIDDIGQFETKFTKYFADAGFVWDTFVDLSDYETNINLNFCANYELPYSLLKYKKMPFLRRKSLTQSAVNSSGGPEKEAARALEYISKYTNYNISIIWEDLLRKNNILDLYTRQHNAFVLPTAGIINKRSKNIKVALFLHLYYIDEIEYCLKFAENMPLGSDIIVSTCEENFSKVSNAIKKNLYINSNFNLKIIRVQNRGRDVSALFVGCSQIIKKGKYDYICCIHDKKSSQVGPLFGKAFRDTTFENMLASRDYIENILGLFENNPHLGYLGFPKIIGGPYWGVYAQAWSVPNNFEEAIKLLKRCNIEVPISFNKPPISYGNVFWCRPQAIDPLFNLGLRYEDFPPEPLPIDGSFSHGLERIMTYIAQNKGYYSGILFTTEYASIYLVALQTHFSKLFNAQNSNINQSNNIPKKQLLILLIKSILKNNKHLYNIAKLLKSKIF